MGFKNWFENNLGEYKQDIVNYGCDAGYPDITYNSDGAKIFNRYQNEILSHLEQQTEEFGHENVMDFVKCFSRADMAENWFKTGKMDDSTKMLLVWMMCENIAHGFY